MSLHISEIIIVSDNFQKIQRNLFIGISARPWWDSEYTVVLKKRKRSSKELTTKLILETFIKRTNISAH